MFIDLPESILDRILGLVPLRQRCGVLSLVCKDFHNSVNRTVTAVAFYKEDMDSLSEEKTQQFLHKYGENISHINFDLFRSTYAEESTQWMWRQAVVGIAKSCKNLTALDVMICNRHRLRDKDLETIFKECPNLSSLKIDAQYLSGHCFKFTPPLKRLEMEMCNRINETALQAMFVRLRSLRSLYISQMHLLSDKLVKQMVRSFKQLRELSIVSHPETVYPNLSGSGLCLLASLPLKTLIVEGLGAVTDQFLGAISNSEYLCSTTIESLSLAFCYNVGIHGLKRLARMKKMENLSLDGIVKRDISVGVEQIAASGHLVRLFVSEGTNIAPESLQKIVELSPKLRLLDITNNETVFNWITANKWVSMWAVSGRPQLTVLTDNHLSWNVISRPDTDLLGRPPVKVVHLCYARVPTEELMPTTILTDESPLSLSPGTLFPSIRIGNRYRLVFMSLGPAQKTHVEFFEDQSELTAPLVPAFATGLEAFTQGAAQFEAVLPPTGSEDLFSSVVPLGRNNSVLNVTAEQEDKLVSHQPAESSELDLENNPDLANLLSFGASNPLAPDWSVDVMNLLLTTHAFEDGAQVGDNVVKEGLLFNSDGSVTDLTLTMIFLDDELAVGQSAADVPLERKGAAQRGSEDEGGGRSVGAIGDDRGHPFRIYHHFAGYDVHYPHF